tara:strand:+ start:898 stop:1545 length:648 start_codon:yes stop_codon:yes gene_type:complete
MTYLNLVNGVLRRLRENEVATVQADSYSKLIGDLVNDAKDLVESAWDWSALRTTLAINTVDGTYNYSLTGSGDKIKELNVINDTSNLNMEYRTNNWFDDKFYVGTPASGAPEYYTYAGTDSNGDMTIDVYPKPDAVYALRFDSVKRNGVLSADSDTLSVPENPVVQLAVAFAVRERGETGGTSTAEYFQIANKYLSDAVAHDAGRHPEELIFFTP